MENYIIIPSLYYFLIFQIFFNNLRHKTSKFDDSNAGEIVLTFFTFALWIVGLSYCGYYAYLTEWYVFPIIITAAMLFDITFTMILTTLLVFGGNTKIGIFLNLHKILRNTLLCVVASVFFAFQMFISLIYHNI